MESSTLLGRWTDSRRRRSLFSLPSRIGPTTPAVAGLPSLTLPAGAVSPSGSPGQSFAASKPRDTSPRNAARAQVEPTGFGYTPGSLHPPRIPGSPPEACIPAPDAGSPPPGSPHPPPPDAGIRQTISEPPLNPQGTPKPIETASKVPSKQTPKPEAKPLVQTRITRL